MNNSNVTVTRSQDVRNFGAQVMFALESAADRVAVVMERRAQAAYEADDAIASRATVDSVRGYVASLSPSEIVIEASAYTKQAAFIEFGRGMGPIPLIEDPEGRDEAWPQVLVEWMKDKGITPTQGSSEEDYREAARNIGWHLLHTDLPGRFTLTNALDDLFDSGEIQRIVSEEIAQFARRFNG